MKNRWMTSVIETSKQAQPALPFQRGSRPSRAAKAGQKDRKVA